MPARRSPNGRASVWSRLRPASAEMEISAVEPRSRRGGLPGFADESGSFGGGQCLVDPRKRCDPLRHERRRAAFRHVFRHRRDDRGADAGSPHRLREARAAASQSASASQRSMRGKSREQREVEAAREHGGERLRHCRFVAPDEGVIVERIGDRDELVERRRDAVAGPESPSGRNWTCRAGHGIGDQRRFSSRATHGAEGAARQGAMHVQELQGFEELRHRAHTRHAERA